MLLFLMIKIHEYFHMFMNSMLQLHNFYAKGFKHWFFGILSPVSVKVRCLRYTIITQVICLEI